MCHLEHRISRNQCLPGLKKINKQLLGKLLKISNTFQNQKGKVHLTWKLYCAEEAEVSPPQTEETSENWWKCGKEPSATPLGRQRPHTVIICERNPSFSELRMKYLEKLHYA